MTPTPAETALWRALNREPERPLEQLGSAWQEWFHLLHKFEWSHPADRLAYFEGPLYEAGWHLKTESYRKAFAAIWYPNVENERILGTISATSTVSHWLARFHASARALAALGVITDDVMKEIEDAKQ